RPASVINQSWRLATHAGKLGLLIKLKYAHSAGRTRRGGTGMRIGRLPRRRSWTQRTVLASIGTLVFAISGVAAGLAGYLSAATDAGVRTTLEAAVAGDAAVEVAIHGGGDQTAAHTAITDHRDRLLTGVPYRLQRHAVGPPPGDAVRTRYRLVIDTRRLDRAGAETLMAAVTRLDGRLSGDAR